jgi:predicted XRE-type DNA-binding protein
MADALNSPDVLTIQALRSDVALQVARCLKRRGLNQREGAKWLNVPQPTLSKIVNGRVTDLSLELLIRIAVRAGLPVILQTGQVPAEAGAFISLRRRFAAGDRGSSKLANGARNSLIDSIRRLTPEQRLNAFLEHSQLVRELHAAGRSAENARARQSRRPT